MTVGGHGGSRWRTPKIYEFESDVDGLVCASWSFGDPQAMFQQLTGDSPADAGR
jgi:hypothetical protein